MSIRKSDNPTTETRRAFLRTTLTASAGLAATRRIARSPPRARVRAWAT